MRQYKAAAVENAFSILALDDDPIMTSTIESYFQRSGYHVDVENDPTHAIERIRNGTYDILLLDFLMTPICGDQVVEEIRKFNHDLCIILLTGHKTMAPPIRTIRALDIQGYYEKSDRFDQLELLVESCVKSIRQMRTIRRYQDGLTGVMAALPGIYHLQSVEHILDDALQAMTGLLDSAGSILMLDLARCGLQTDVSEQYISRATGTQLATADHGQIAQIFSLVEQNGYQVQGNQMFFRLATETRVIGLLGMELHQAPEYDQIQLLHVFSRQVSAALSNSLLHALVKAKNRELDEAYTHLRDSYTQMISTVRGIVDAKDYYTRDHSDRVACFAVALARYMGRDDAYCERLQVAGIFHDIGKLGIPDRILLKESKLTPEEFDVIKTHCTRGATLLAGVTYFQDMIPAILHHHEKYDGTGYPDGLAGENIPEQARMIAVADSFDAMVSDRRYRKSLGLDLAIEELVRGKERQFDPAMVDAFVALAQTPDFMKRTAEEVHKMA